MVDLGDHNGLLPLEILSVHMDANGGFVAVHASRGGHLHKLIVALGDVADGDGAIRLGLLGGDNLAVPQHQKNGPGQGLATLVHLLQHDLDLGRIFKNQADIGFAVPHEGLLDLGHVRAEDEALRWGDLLRQKRPGG